VPAFGAYKNYLNISRLAIFKMLARKKRQMIDVWSGNKEAIIHRCRIFDNIFGVDMAMRLPGYGNTGWWLQPYRQLRY